MVRRSGGQLFLRFRFPSFSYLSTCNFNKLRNKKKFKERR